MSDSSVAVVVPSLDDRPLLERCLPPLLEEVARRAGRDRVLVVDDSGRARLAGWAAARFPAVEVLSLPENGGFARAALAGARHATQPYLLLLNPDVVVRAGLLDLLLAQLSSPEVFAVTPRVLLEGDPTRVESSNALVWEEERLVVRERAGGGGARVGDPLPTAFGIGGALLLRREEFAARGFDPLFEPFYWEDVDLCLAAWRSGRRVLEVPGAVVEHHHRGSIGPRVPQAQVRATIERNRWLLAWKHLDEPARIERHMVAIARVWVDASLSGRRDALIELLLALERLEQLEQGRASLAGAARTLEQVLALCDPDG